MRLFVNAYDAQAPLAELKSLGWAGARRDVASRSAAAAVLAEHYKVGMPAILLVNAPPEEAVRIALDILPEVSAWPDVSIEIGNEWDRSAAPEAAREAWRRVYEAANTILVPTAPDGLQNPVPVVTGGISSLSADALGWLKAALPPWPWCPALIAGFHGYMGNATVDPLARAGELQALQGILGGRPAWNTETGWHQASVSRGFPLCWTKRPGLTSEQVLQNLIADVRAHEAAGIARYVVYQLNDGPSDAPEDRFGIRSREGTWKAQAYLPVTLSVGRRA